MQWSDVTRSLRSANASPLHFGQMIPLDTSLAPQELARLNFNKRDRSLKERRALSRNRAR